MRHREIRQLIAWERLVGRGAQIRTEDPLLPKQVPTLIWSFAEISGLQQIQVEWIAAVGWISIDCYSSGGIFLLRFCYTGELRARLLPELLASTATSKAMTAQ